ncbi:hypothetical protein ACFGVR_14240 [Mucilaginibacter sp. AW1-3]
MEEDFDKRLTSHMKAVFDDTDSSGADAGWLLLREKYLPKNDRKPLAWFWWLTAIIIISGLAIWQVEKKTANDKPIKRVAKSHNDSAQKQGLPQHVDSKTPGIVKASTLSVNNNPATQPVKKEPKSAVIRSLPLRNKSEYKSLHKQYPNTLKFDKQTAPKTNIIPVNQNTLSGSSVLVDNSVKAFANSKVVSDSIPDLILNTLPDGIAHFLIDRVKLEFTQLEPGKLKAASSDTSAQKTKPAHGQRVIWGVFASAFYSTATGSDHEFNLGAGGTADIRLSDHFSFSTGLGLMRSSLNYNIVPGSGRNGNNLYASSGAGGGQVVFPPTQLFNNYIARIWAIDVPLNLKYSFAKPYNFIAAGLSSNVYISEYYDGVYTYVPTSAGLADVHNITQNHFGHTDLLKTFNLSFGLGYPISNKSVLIFEPFLKAPLGGLGSQQLKYTLFGINLKLNFQSKAK